MIVVDLFGLLYYDYLLGTRNPKHLSRQHSSECPAEAKTKDLLFGGAHRREGPSLM